jgi:regulator of cell morphogenesis and NO signaling
MQTLSTPTVRDIAADSLAAVRVFEKFGIDYCCGGKRPLHEVCEERATTRPSCKANSMRL